VFDPLDPLAMNGGQQILLGEQLSAHRLWSNLAVMDQDSGFTLDDPLDMGAARDDECQYQIGGQEYACANHPAGHRIVVSDHGVLQDVRQRQQNDDVERGQLAQLTPAEDPDGQEEEDVHGYRPDGSLLP